MSPFSWKTAQGDPRRFLGEQVSRHNSHREDTYPLSFVSGEAGRECAQVPSSHPQCLSSDSPVQTTVISSSPIPAKGLPSSPPLFSPCHPRSLLLPPLLPHPFLPPIFPPSFHFFFLVGRWGKWGIVFRSDLEFPFHLENE